MQNPFFYVLLLVLVVLDSWLLAHPNLIGKAGVFLFEYSAIETFPKAFGTVSIVVAVALMISWAVGRLKQTIAVFISIALLAASTYYLLQSFTQYNTGVYKLTGTGFRAGAVLLPGLIVVIFGKSAWDAIINKGS